MGNNNTNGATEGIEYIRSIEDSNFGPVELYRRNDIEYIMKKTFTFVNSDTASDRLRQCLTFMEKQKHASLAPVHHLTVRKQSHLCIEYQRHELYVDYYNYTFANIIQTQKVLQMGELWYALNSLCDLGTILSAHNITVSPFALDNIFVSLKGAPCVYLVDAGMNSEDFTQCQQLALSITSLVTLKKIEQKENYGEELMAVLKKSPDLKEILEKMIEKEVGFEEVLEFIDNLITKGKVKLANSLRLSKFKALIPIAHLQVKQAGPVSVDVANYHSQPTNHTQTDSISSKAELKQTPLLVRPIESLKQLEQRKLQDKEQQKRMKQRMEKFLGKENLSINRTITQNSEKKIAKKPQNHSVMSRPSALNRKAALL